MMAAAGEGPEPPSLCEVGGSGTLILPIFGDSEQRWPRELRIVLYLLGLGWAFMGVAIVSDVFMGAIERITSKRRRKMNHVTGRAVTVHVWNPTVANLTLMALGSSAPEILLSVIETVAINGMFSGELGPSTIVGSAAFNLFVIIAVCVSAVPDGEVRKIKETQVYAVTAIFSVFAYVWMIIVLLLISPHVVDPWEGILTFLLFPILVSIAYAADIGYLSPGGRPAHMSDSNIITADITKEELAEMQVEIRKDYGSQITDEQMMKIVSLKCREKTSRAQYRVAATRKMLGGKKVEGPVHKNSSMDFLGLGNRSKIVPVHTVEEEDPDRSTCSIEFGAANYVVLENAGVVRVKVLRRGVSEVVAIVKYRSRDGTAKASTDDRDKSNPDYIKVEGVLNFGPGETEKFIDIKILDDNTYEEDEWFFLDLFSMIISTQDTSKDVDASLIDAVTREVVTTATTRVTIIDDDMAGVIAWAREEEHVPTKVEDQVIHFEVSRRNGSKGKITCQYTTENATALAGTDYAASSGTIELDDGVCVAQVLVKILAKGRYGTSDCFRIILTEVKGNGAKLDAVTDGGADSCILTVYLDSDSASMERVDKIMSHLRARWDKAKVGHSSWKEQFVTAVTVGGGDDDDDSAEGGGPPSWSDYAVHIIAVPWKLLFALCPPVDYCGGWLCFVVSLIFIGGVTILIGDLASLFGCVLPFMENEITAITFVAMGTSLPDTFASKQAAEQDPYADASVGNVTGSNSVNVFLGLGLPWMIASLFWSCKSANSHDKWDALYQHDPDLWRLGPPGQRHPAFVVKAGGLVFSVLVFSCFAVICISILFARRRFFGGELGGPKVAKRLTSAGLVFLWFLYILLSSLKVKGVF